MTPARGEEKTPVSSMLMDTTHDGGEKWGLEEDLVRTIVSVIELDSNPRKIPLKMISDPDKFMSLIIPRGAKKVVLVLSRERMGFENQYKESVRKVSSSAVVMVLFSHKLDKDVMLIFFK